MADTTLRILSWNIKDFGTYDYSSTVELMALYAREADIITILEIACNRFSKSVTIGSVQTRSVAFNAVEGLVDLLHKNDPNADWAANISGANAGSAKRDAYAFLWKKKPVNCFETLPLP